MCARIDICLDPFSLKMFKKNPIISSNVYKFGDLIHLMLSMQEKDRKNKK